MVSEQSNPTAVAWLDQNEERGHADSQHPGERALRAALVHWHADSAQHQRSTLAADSQESSQGACGARASAGASGSCAILPTSRCTTILGNIGLRSKWSQDSMKAKTYHEQQYRLNGMLRKHGRSMVHNLAMQNMKIRKEPTIEYARSVRLRLVDIFS